MVTHILEKLTKIFGKDQIESWIKWIRMILKIWRPSYERKHIVKKKHFFFIPTKHLHKHLVSRVVSFHLKTVRLFAS